MTKLGLPVRPGSPSRPRPAEPGWPAAASRTGWPPRSRPPGGPGGGDGPAAGRRGRPAARLGPLRCRGVDARDDGDRPQRRHERRARSRGWPPGAATRGSPGTATAGWSRCSAPRCSGSRPTRFADVLDTSRTSAGLPTTSTSRPADLEALVDTFKSIVRDETGRDFPQQPREQLDLAIRAVFDSWNTDRAKIYRRQERIADDSGTAVNVCAMVFGNLGPDSGTGVASPVTRRAASRASMATTCPTLRARMSCRRHPQHRAAHRPRRMPTQRRTTSCWPPCRRWSRTTSDLCDIEFTVEAGKLWMLQTRVGKRTPAAAFRIAMQLVDEGSHRPRRGPAAGHRRAAGPADVPAVRRRREAGPDRHRHGGEPRCGSGQGGVRLGDGGGLGRRRRGRDPGPPRDQPGRPRRHGGGSRAC